MLRCILKKFPLAFLALISCGSADAQIKGAYLGVGAGWVGMSAKPGGTIAVGFAPKDRSSKYTSTGSIQLFGGHGTRLDAWYVGGELFIDIPLGVASTTRAAGTGMGGVTSYRKGWSFGLTPIIGYVFKEKFLLYTRFGLEMSKDYMAFKDTAVPSVTQTSPKKWGLGFVLGIGGAYALTKHIRLRLEYQYKNKNTLSHTFAPANTLSQKCVIQGGYLSLAYQF